MEALGINLHGLIAQIIRFGIPSGLVFAIVYILFFKRR